MSTSRTQHVEDDTAYICENCKHIDLPELLSGEPMPDECEQFTTTLPKRIVLKHQDPYDLDPRCSICSLLIAALPRFYFPPFGLTRGRGDEILGPAATCYLETEGDVHFHETRPGVLSNENTVYRIITEASKKCLTDRRINFQQLKFWIDCCHRDHLQLCIMGQDWIHVNGMDLIDVHNRCIVPAPHHQVHYAALSYVWGTPQSQDEFHIGLPALLPKTIDDAIQATQRLGLDYLWVDRYCIPQHGDEIRKGHQIKNMHRIYQQAHVTLVSAVGDGPNHGLPGVNSPRPLPTHRTINGRLFVALSNQPLQDGTIWDSRWNSRAWTYQEEVFSRRILYFTESQVVFQCKSDFCGIDDPVRNHACSELRHLRKPGSMLGKSGRNMASHMRALNDRQIMSETDRLNAITGILNHMKEKQETWGHLFGVFIHKYFWSGGSRLIGNRKHGFLTGLMWEGSKPGGRRREFPSWSWVGWKVTCFPGRYVDADMASIYFELQADTGIFPVLSETKPSSDRIRLQEEPPSGTISSDEFWPMLQSPDWQDSYCQVIHIKAPIIHFQFHIDDRGRWRLSFLEDHPVDEYARVSFDSLSLDEPPTLQAATPNTFRGLLFFRREVLEIFVIVLQDFEDYSERIGSWKTSIGLLANLQTANDEGYKGPLSCHVDIDMLRKFDIKKFARERMETVRLK